MKCTNFREELELIHKKELNELIAALEAHGGEYEFADEDAMDDLDAYPLVSVNVDLEVGLLRVMKAHLDNRGYPWLAGKLTLQCSGEDYIRDIDPWDVVEGEMANIISMMDEPEA